MKIIYVYDALCGWCYGFSPIIQAFHERYADRLDIEVVSGGMITDSRIGPIGEVAPYIKWAYKEVEQRTGVTFGQGFLNDVLEEGSTVFSSVPPAQALSVFKRSAPDRALSFAGRLQRAVYYDGIPPLEFKRYGPLAEEYGLDAETFVVAMQQESAVEMAQRDFQRSRQLGVRGFPTVFLESDGKLAAIVSGYVSLADLDTNYRRARATLEK